MFVYQVPVCTDTPTVFSVADTEAYSWLIYYRSGQVLPVFGLAFLGWNLFFVISGTLFRDGGDAKM